MFLSIVLIIFVASKSENCPQHFWLLLLFLSNCATAQQQANFTHTTATLSEARCYLAATSSGELVFFGGGYSATGLSDRVDIYNVTSGSWTTATLSIPRAQLAATSSGNLVFFAGGLDAANIYNQVDIYNISDGSWSTATLSQAHFALAATSVGNLVLFGGGSWSSGSSNVVDIYNVTSNTWANASLSVARTVLAATSTDTLALFGGGHDSTATYYGIVDVYNVSNGMWSTLAPNMSVSRASLTASSIGNVIVFAGGETAPFCPTVSNAVDVYNLTSDVHSTFTLSVPRCFLSSSVVGNIVLIGGGGNNTAAFDTVDIFNITNETWNVTSLSQPRLSLASTSCQNQIFFGGGMSNIYDLTTASSVVDIFIFNNISSTTTSQTSSNTPTSLGSTSFPFSSGSSPSLNNSQLLSSPFSFISTLSQSSPTTPQNELSNTVVVGIVVGIVALLIAVGLILFLTLFIKKRRKRKIQIKRSHNENNEMIEEKSGAVVTESNMNTVVFEHETNTTTPMTTTLSTYQPGTETLKSLSPGQIPLNELEIDREIGQGTYGRVCVGKWKKYRVALKFCQNRGKMNEFLREANLMISLPPHPNVVRIYGVSIDGTQPIIVMEYCAGGSLDKLLYDNEQQISLEVKLRWVYEIAVGMSHLHKFNIVHRDLAARNILLSHSNPNNAQLKISDFGMSRVLQEDIEFRTKSSFGPVCWMAPESIRSQVYSKQSDVWMFGMVVYEIVARREPHADKSPFNVSKEIRDKFVTPEIPSDCPEKLRQVMQMCWQQDPKQRPSFETICQMFEH